MVSARHLKDDLLFGVDSRWSWITALFCAWVLFFSMATIRIGGILFYGIVETFGVTRAEASWPVSLAGTIMVMGGPIAGYLCRRFTCRACPVSVLISGRNWGQPVLPGEECAIYHNFIWICSWCCVVRFVRCLQRFGGPTLRETKSNGQRPSVRSVRPQLRRYFATARVLPNNLRCPRCFSSLRSDSPQCYSSRYYSQKPSMADEAES
ncbi:uncharacterized protein LOC119454376 isoform X2 [Dermacentor silvarum]|uniref:uncharacterized protein LOC119454376 isoform X2 n=1 Tax=Dermacentor silvarum TaxID=543639 RepID=UPI00210136E1|nr:uncharacterized protein LOC119454376 isoform X2 [Dermacentor silvarum]